jgi:hypothetical protein
MVRSLRYILCVLLILPDNFHAQLISNQVSYGTIAFDNPRILKLSDEKFLIGTSNPAGISGTKECSNFGNTDFWLFKMDEDNSILWQLCYGGSESENLSNIIETDDGHILICGRSNSPISGNKTVGTNGGFDFWVIKMDLDGNEVWQRNFGLDLSGNLLNQKTLGGLGFDMPGYFILTDNGEILLSNISSSPVSGNKTSENFGDYDIWLVHLNQDLTILNDFSYGGDKIDGTLFSKMGVENELIIGGFSRSSISGNKTEDSRGFGDAWVLNVNYLNGEINWQKTIGGSLYDYITYLHDEGEYYKVFCASESPISGDKTVGTFGDYDIWIFDLSKTVGLEENDVLKRQVYPNPSTGFFHVSLADGETARIYDLQGKEIAFKFENGMLDLSTLQDGIYLLNIEKTDAEREIIRLVKTQ